MTTAQSKVSMESLASLCKRRGFIFQSSEIYGGINGFWDYGPLGCELKRNIREAWWRDMVLHREDVVGLDCSIIMHPRVWEASGHVGGFTDPMIDCRGCKKRFRADQLFEELGLTPATTGTPEEKFKLPAGTKCPACGAKELTEPRAFNLMFKTFVGPVEDTSSVAYLRPETAQGMFINFKNVIDTTRVRPPFGIAQIGKSFRNEITPGQFVFRTREFEQMEMEFFVPPADAHHWYEYWCAERYQWYLDLGIPEHLLRLRAHDSDELSHYSSGTSDVEFLFPWGWDELEGIANRGDYDLTQHAQHSGERLEWFDQAADERWVPHVIEPAAGATRTAMAFLMAAYDEEEVRGETRVVLRFHPRIAPYKAAVLPLSKKPELTVPARALATELRSSLMCDYDETQSIGRRYRRQDELGTPYCVTYDFDSLEDGAVTIRERDSMDQERVAIPEVAELLRERLA